MSRSIFYGFGAWVGHVFGKTECSWWPDDPATLGFDQSKLIRSNIGKGPKQRRAGQITAADVEVDDRRADGGPTKLGPEFPVASMIGSVWLEKSRYDKLGNGIKPPRVPANMQCRDYELTTVVYYADETGPLANRRFWGVHAKVLQVQGNYALVQIWPPGKSLEAGQAPVGALWLDLTQQVLPPDAEIGGAIGPGVAAGTEGGMYLDSGSYSTLSGGNDGPKLPKAQGGAVVPFLHRRS